MATGNRFRMKRFLPLALLAATPLLATDRATLDLLVQKGAISASETERLPADATSSPPPVAPKTPGLANAQAAIIRQRLADYLAEHSAPAPHRLHVVYFLPKDATLPPDAPARLDRMVRHIRDFFRDELNRTGFGPLTFPIETDDLGKLRLHVVEGEKPADGYSTGSFFEISRVARSALHRRGIPTDASYLLIIAALRDGAAPYAGIGTVNGGNCIIVDLPHLDPARFADPAPVPGGSRTGAKSIGQDNTIYIGGAAHELGHAFGQPHNRELAAEKASVGTSLMGAGNYTFRNELRGAGLGAFLTEFDAVAFATHPLFTGKIRDFDRPASATVSNFSVAGGPDRLLVSGTIRATPPLAALALMADPAGNQDYDALTQVTPTAEDGGFAFNLPLEKQGKHHLRLVAYHLNGKRTVLGRAEVGWAGVSAPLPVSEIIVGKDGVRPVPENPVPTGVRSAPPRAEPIPRPGRTAGPRG